jgi:nicotinamidase-related amidase
MLEKPVWDKLCELGKKKVVLYGIEAHVCVKQTCLDLLERGFEVVLVVDAITSMSYHDRTAAIEVMRDAGATITTF